MTRGQGTIPPPRANFDLCQNAFGPRWDSGGHADGPVALVWVPAIWQKSSLGPALAVDPEGGA